MFIHVFVYQGLEGEIWADYSSLGCEGLVGVCDPWFFVGRAIRSDLGAVSRDVPCIVCSNYRDIVTGAGVPVAQVDDWVGAIDHQGVYGECSLLPNICRFRVCVDVTVLKYAKDGDSGVSIDLGVSDDDWVVAQHNEEGYWVGDPKEGGEIGFMVVSGGSQAIHFIGLPRRWVSVGITDRVRDFVSIVARRSTSDLVGLFSFSARYKTLHP